MYKNFRNRFLPHIQSVWKVSLTRINFTDAIYCKKRAIVSQIKKTKSNNPPRRTCIFYGYPHPAPPPHTHSRMGYYWRNNVVRIFLRPAPLRISYLFWVIPSNPTSKQAKRRFYFPTFISLVYCQQVKSFVFI